MRRSVLALLALAAGACSSPQASSTPPPAPTPTGVPVPGSASPPSASASAASAATQAQAPAPAAPSFDEVASILGASAADVGGCGASLPADARMRCLFEARYRGDEKAGRLANELLSRWQIVAGVEAAHMMDGGYRGMIRIEPALPLGAERKHIAWIVDAFRDYDAFFEDLARYGAAHGGASVRYRFRPLTLRFMRSVAARTPSAYAEGWTVAWNLAGSLHTSGDAARETLFHEIFHLNDAAAGEPTSWSPGALGGIYDAVVRRCGTKIACLAPYSPNDTIVRGGTYYSFQPGNDVREYAAELALRYYREQRAALRGLARPKPFKCGPPENGRAWQLVRDEFFGGIDAVPPCG
jgi:hypothetical protein